MSIARTVVVLAMLALGACSREDQQFASPQEPGPNATGFYCGMTIKEHMGPKGQIVAKNAKATLWFSSVHDALTYADQEVASDKEILGFWVNDMTQSDWEKPAPGTWIEAKGAWYVVGSSKSSSMGGAEAVPFKTQAAADAFAKEFGGKAVDFTTARREMAAATGEMPAEKGKS